MKKRLGFVSNSSSSSFIIIFDKDPKSATDVHKMLFGDDEITLSHCNCSLPSKEGSETIFKDILKCESVDYLKEEFNNIAYSMKYTPDNEYDWLIKKDDKDLIEYLKNIKKEDNWYKFREKPQSEQDRFNDKQEVLMNNIVTKMAHNFALATQGKHVYTAEFSDNDSQGYMILEHGGVFSNVKHIRISKH